MSDYPEISDRLAGTFTEYTLVTYYFIRVLVEMKKSWGYILMRANPALRRKKPLSNDELEESTEPMSHICVKWKRKFEKLCEICDNIYRVVNLERCQLLMGSSVWFVFSQLLLGEWKFTYPKLWMICPLDQFFVNKMSFVVLILEYFEPKYSTLNSLPICFSKILPDCIIWL